MKLMDQFLTSNAEFFITRFELRVHRAPDGEQRLAVMLNLYAEVFGNDERIEQRVGEDRAPAEQVHSEQLRRLMLLVKLADVLLQVNIVRRGRENPKRLQLRRERESFRDFLIDLRLGQRLDRPDRLLLTLQTSPPPAGTANNVHALLTLTRPAVPYKSGIIPHRCKSVCAELLKLLPGLRRRKIKMNQRIHPTSI